MFFMQNRFFCDLYFMQNRFDSILNFFKVECCLLLVFFGFGLLFFTPIVFVRFHLWNFSISRIELNFLILNFVKCCCLLFIVLNSEINEMQEEI